MLAGMSATEFDEWITYYQHHFFDDALLDAHFSALNLTIVSLVCGKNTLTTRHFSLLNPYEIEIAQELDDEQLMALAESVPGGIRYGPVSG